MQITHAHNFNECGKHNQESLFKGVTLWSSVICHSVAERADMAVTLCTLCQDCQAQHAFTATQNKNK